MASNNTKTTREQRDHIMQLTFKHGAAIAQSYASGLGLKDDYVMKVMRARGLVPRTAKRWGRLREVA
jgi:hypothetical protein